MIPMRLSEIIPTSFGNRMLTAQPPPLPVAGRGRARRDPGDGAAVAQRVLRADGGGDHGWSGGGHGVDPVVPAGAVCRLVPGAATGVLSASAARADVALKDDPREAACQRWVALQGIARQMFTSRPVP